MYMLVMAYYLFKRLIFCQNGKSTKIKGVGEVKSVDAFYFRYDVYSGKTKES